jgi:hypothetical protein
VANGTPSGPRTSVKAPLVFSTVMAVVAGAVVLMVSTGGTRHVPRWDLAFIAFGVAFIVCLVVAAMLSMSYKENDEHLGKGSGIHRSSATRPRPGQPGRDGDDRRQDGNG